MISYLPDIVFVLIAIVTAIFVARQMMVESALTFLALLIASLVATTLFEPIADWCVRNLFSLSDLVVTKFLWSSFAIFTFTLVFCVLHQEFMRVVGEVPQFGRRAESIGCSIFGGLSGYLLAAFLLTIVHAMPGPRDFWGAFEPDARHRPGPVMAIAPDYQFLSFVDYTCVPRSAITGMPWKLGGPIISTDVDEGHWASFPLRFAIWREGLAFIASDYDAGDRIYEDVESDSASADDEPGDWEDYDDSENDPSGADYDSGVYEPGEPGYDPENADKEPSASEFDDGEDAEMGEEQDSPPAGSSGEDDDEYFDD